MKFLKYELQKGVMTLNCKEHYECFREAVRSRLSGTDVFNEFKILPNNRFSCFLIIPAFVTSIVRLRSFFFNQNMKLFVNK